MARCRTLEDPAEIATYAGQEGLRFVFATSRSPAQSQKNQVADTHSVILPNRVVYGAQK
jgi:hypothetical protein